MRASLLAAGLGLTVNAHLFISSPTPIEGTAIKSPLDPSGSDFPCHGVSLPTSGGEQMSAGSSQMLAFDNGDGANWAVHGGGSCQISITYETDAAKVKDPTNWFVIYSIEGGCPSNTHQNLDGSFQGPQGAYTGALACSDPRSNGVDCINQFNFTIPKGVKDGHAIMSWTWFNSVGNREIYQNCVNAEFSGGDGSEMSSFPTMFVANLASVDTCPTTQSVDLLFPNPGKYVTTKKPSGEAAKTAITFPMATPTGAGCAGDGGAPHGSYGPGGPARPHPLGAPGPSFGPPAAAHSAAMAHATAAGAGRGKNAPATITTMATVTGGGASAPSAASASYSYTASSSSSAAAVAAVASSPASSDSNASSSGSGASNASPAGSCTNGAVACSTEGDVVCIGSDQFGLCNFGCAVPQPLAAGTHCSGGTISKRRRSTRHARKHLADRRGL